MEGKAEKNIIAMGISLLMTDDGVKNVLPLLDRLFEKENIYQMYEAYRKFESVNKCQYLTT